MTRYKLVRAWCQGPETLLDLRFDQHVWRVVEHATGRTVGAADVLPVVVCGSCGASLAETGWCESPDCDEH